jgi:hypothetical protein
VDATLNAALAMLQLDVVSLHQPMFSRHERRSHDAP